MRSLVLLVVSIALFATLHAAVDEPRSKKGGFTGATPKPAAKPSAADDSAPAPERSTPREGAPKPKKSTSAESTPKPTKAISEDGNSPAPKRSTEGGSTPKSKKSTVAESTPKSKKPGEDESTPAPKKKKTPADATVAAEKKPEAAELPPKSADAEPAKSEHAPAATLEPDELAEFASQPPRVQALITAALELTKLNLTYTYGSADPAQGGMDCSGAMNHLLTSQGFKDVPRDSSSQYVWARKAGPFFAVVSKSAGSFEFKDLQPGDLLFWTGTYATGREIPISHVMLYLGTEKKRKQRVMFGSSDGRSYEGIQRWGVSVFDFKMPNSTGSDGETSKVDFVGYGRIPQLRTPQEIAADEEKTAVQAAAEAASPDPKRSATSKPRTSAKSQTKKRGE